MICNLNRCRWTWWRSMCLCLFVNYLYRKVERTSRDGNRTNEQGIDIRRAHVREEIHLIDVICPVSSADGDRVQGENLPNCTRIITEKEMIYSWQVTWNYIAVLDDLLWSRRGYRRLRNTKYYSETMFSERQIHQFLHTFFTPMSDELIDFPLQTRATFHSVFVRTKKTSPAFQLFSSE